MSKRVCMCLDLVNDDDTIKEYEHYHESEVIWPEIVKSIHDAGVLDMEIYRCENRLFMIMEVDQNFSLENKVKMDHLNQKVQEWESMMQSRFQQALPWRTEIKWEVMQQIFKLPSNTPINNRTI